MNYLINNTIDVFNIFLNEVDVTLDDIQYALNEDEINIDVDLFNSLIETYLFEEASLEEEMLSEISTGLKLKAKLERSKRNVNQNVNNGINTLKKHSGKIALGAMLATNAATGTYMHNIGHDKGIQNTKTNIEKGLKINGVKSPYTINQLHNSGKFGTKAATSSEFKAFNNNQRRIDDQKIRSYNKNMLKYTHQPSNFSDERQRSANANFTKRKAFYDKYAVMPKTEKKSILDSY